MNNFSTSIENKYDIPRTRCYTKSQMKKVNDGKKAVKNALKKTS